MTTVQEDYIAIVNLINRVDRLAAQKNVAAYRALFTQDAMISGVKGSAAGGQLNDFLNKIWEAEGHTLHLTTSVIVSAIQTEHARASSVLMIIDRTSRQVLAVNQIAHTLVKTSTGWLFSARQIQ